MSAMLDPLIASVKIDQVGPLVFGGKNLLLADGTLTKEGWSLLSAAVSIVVYALMYLLSRVFTPLVYQSYSKLSKVDRRNWDTRYSGTVHAALCVLFGYELLWTGDFFWKESPVPMVLRSNELSSIALGHSLGYFIVDLISTFKYSLGGPEMLLHHCGSLLAVLTAFVTGQGHMHTVWMLVTEFTTPLINNRWWLDAMGLRSHWLYVINGLAIVFAWIPARIVLFPPFFYVVWQTRDQLENVHLFCTVLMVFVPAVLMLLNLFWFYKIVKGAYKVLFCSKGKDVKHD